MKTRDIIFGLISLSIIIIVIQHHQYSVRIQKLEKDLDNSRIIAGDYLDRWYESAKKRGVEQAIVNKKVDNLVKDINRFYPGYSKRFEKRVFDGYDNPDLIEKIPESLSDLWKMSLHDNHSLEKYSLSVSGIQWPVEAKNGYVAGKMSEFYQWRWTERAQWRHSGIDINNKSYAQVRAVADGKIWKVYYDRLGGWTIELKFQIEEKWYFTRYRHLDKVHDFVKKGEEVKQGQVIAAIGNTGAMSLGNHLHWEMWELRNRWVNINPVMNSTWNNDWKKEI